MEGREGRERRQNPAPHKVPRSVRWSHLAVACAVEGDRVEGRGEVEGRSIGVRRVVARPLGPRHEVRTEARVLGVVVGEGGDPRLVGVGGQCSVVRVRPRLRVRVRVRVRVRLELGLRLRPRLSGRAVLRGRGC